MKKNTTTALKFGKPNNTSKYKISIKYKKKK